MTGTTNPDSFTIRGGQPLSGTIAVSGGKNAATKILLATILSAEESIIQNVPILGDTQVTAELVEHVGGKITKANARWSVMTKTISSGHVPPLSRKNRIPVLALGPLLHRTGEVEIPFVGGDQIGPRPVDFHVAALRMMGAEITVEADRVIARSKRLHGATIPLPYPSVGATENIILAAVLAEGKTTVRNAATEPEVLDLIQMLQSMGAIIELGTGRTVHIEGVKRLHGTAYTVMPDRNEAVSFACIALATKGDILVQGARQDHLLTWLNSVRRMGGGYEISEAGIRFFHHGALQGVRLETDTHPGFMTDWQQPTVTVLTQARGESIVHETVYEDRFGYTEALCSMGADIETNQECLGVLPCRWWARGYTHSARIKGPTPLHGATIEIPDIRAGMAQVIAALVAEGTSTLNGISHLDRGYQELDGRLTKIGARIERQSTVY